MGNTIHTDVLVVGSGGAALRAAIAAIESRPDIEVILATRGKLGASGVTSKACSDRMAFHATLPTTAPGGPDSWKYHAQDIFEIGGQVSDRPLAQILAARSAEAFDYLDKLGVPFSKDESGKPDQFVTDGSEYPRACFTGPYTAVHIEAALVRRIKSLPVRIIEDVCLIEVLTADGRACGATFLNEQASGDDDGPRTICAGAVVLATGGPGQLFETNLFPEESKGSATGAALLAGAELVNMEFIQIGLASLDTKLACSGSMMRCVPQFLNELGEQFLLKFFPGEDPMKVYELVFRKGATWPTSVEHRTFLIDVAVAREIEAGHSIYLSFMENPEGFDFFRFPEDIVARYRAEVKEVLFGARSSSPIWRLREINSPVIKWFKDRNIDLVGGDKIRLAPCIQHFQGGIKIDQDAQTCLKGLFAAGEAAGGQHGANRPGGNALLDGQVFGRMAGECAAASIIKSDNSNATRKIASDAQASLTPSTSVGIPSTEARTRLRRIMSGSCGVLRTVERLSKATEELTALKSFGVAEDGLGTLHAAETRLMLEVGLAILRSAALRTESRGPHLMFHDERDKLPLPGDNANWKKYTVVSRDGIEIREPNRSDARLEKVGARG